MYRSPFELGVEIIGGRPAPEWLKPAPDNLGKKLSQILDGFPVDLESEVLICRKFDLPFPILKNSNRK